MVFTRELTEKELEILKKLQNFICMAHSDSDGHDYAHVLSVCKNAITIGSKIKDEVNPFILCAGALLHDIGKTNGVFTHIHGLFGGALAEEFLDGLRVEPKIRDAICRVVIRHTPTSMMPAETPEERIVTDSDTLDRLGLMGLLRGFIGKHHSSMEKLLTKYMERRKHDFDKLHYPASREIGEIRQIETEVFIEIIEDRLQTRMDKIEDLFKKIKNIH